MWPLRRLAFVGCLAWAGCSGRPVGDIDPREDPTGDKRLQEVLRVSAPDPARWSPAATVPLYPVLLTVDTSIKVVDATGRWIAGQLEGLRVLLGNAPSPAPRPEAVDRSADGLRQK